MILVSKAYYLSFVKVYYEKFGKRLPLPRSLRWQRHQNRVGISTGLQTKASATVLHQVELGIAAALDELRMAFGFGK